MCQTHVSDFIIPAPHPRRENPPRLPTHSHVAAYHVSRIIHTQPHFANIRIAARNHLKPHTPASEVARVGFSTHILPSLQWYRPAAAFSSRIYRTTRMQRTGNPEAMPSTHKGARHAKRARSRALHAQKKCTLREPTRGREYAKEAEQGNICELFFLPTHIHVPLNGYYVQ